MECKSYFENRNVSPLNLLANKVVGQWKTKFTNYFPKCSVTWLIKPDVFWPIKTFNFNNSKQKIDIPHRATGKYLLCECVYAFTTVLIAAFNARKSTVVLRSTDTCMLKT